MGLTIPGEGSVARLSVAALPIYGAPMAEPAPAWRAPARLGAAAGVGTVVLGLGNPNTTHVPLCPLKALTGLDCPLCGSLRAVHSLAHLHPVEAASHNLLLTLAAPFLVAGWLVWMHRALQEPGIEARPPRLPRMASAAVVVVGLLYTVLRNMPSFSWLASTA